MPGPVFLQGDGVTLHPVGEDDLEFLRETVLDPNVRRTLGLRQPLTAKQEQEWYEEHASGDERVDLVICIPRDAAPADVDPREDEDTHVRAGSIGLGPVNDLDGKAEIGISVAEAFWGNGYGTEAARLVTDYAFRDLRKHRVAARVFDGNVGSQRVWEKLGYEHEAVHREEQFFDGEHVDVHYYSVLADEWLDRD
jgi:RimJ/RimL family protein N-acetyltransferase